MPVSGQAKGQLGGKSHRKPMFPLDTCLPETPPRLRRVSRAVDKYTVAAWRRLGLSKWSGSGSNRAGWAIVLASRLPTPPIITDLRNLGPLTSLVRPAPPIYLPVGRFQGLLGPSLARNSPKIEHVRSDRLPSPNPSPLIFVLHVFVRRGGACISRNLQVYSTQYTI